MTDNLPEDQLSQLSDFVAATTGLYFPRGRWHDLERRSKLAAREFGFAGPEPLLQWLLASSLTQEQVETLASYLTIAETYFWREPGVFEALHLQILPDLIRARETGERHLRLWSAGCATGEEPFSMAIALREALPARQGWHITILATDINPHMLRRAAAGVYGEWSFRNTPPGFKKKYFGRTLNGQFEILPEIRNMVTFAYLNLATDPFPTSMNGTNAMDLIFCRNVLMYFAPTGARLVGQRLYDCLVEGGWFMVSASELSQLVFPQFAAVRFPGAIVYRRQSGKHQPAVFPAGAPTPAPKIPVQPPTAAATVVAPDVPRPLTRQHPMAGSAKTVETVTEAAVPVGVAQAVRVLANQGKLSEAWAACERAIAADKLNAGLLYIGATILQELNREGDAINILKRALYLDPNFLLAHFALANLAQSAGNPAAARKSFENALALLRQYGLNDILPEAEGLTAGRLREIIRATLQTEL